eukprot:s22_g43.t1
MLELLPDGQQGHPCQIQVTVVPNRVGDLEGCVLESLPSDQMLLHHGVPNGHQGPSQIHQARNCTSDFGSGARIVRHDGGPKDTGRKNGVK